MGTARNIRGAKGAVFTLRVERAKLDQLRAIAAANHSSINQELRRMIDERIARASVKEAA